MNVIARTYGVSLLFCVVFSVHCSEQKIGKPLSPQAGKRTIVVYARAAVANPALKKLFIEPRDNLRLKQKAHNDSHQSSESSSVTIIEPAENPADIITDEYYEYRDLVKEQKMQTAQQQPLFACFFQQCSDCCTVQ